MLDHEHERLQPQRRRLPTLRSTQVSASRAHRAAVLGHAGAHVRQQRRDGHEGQQQRPVHQAGVVPLHQRGAVEEREGGHMVDEAEEVVEGAHCHVLEAVVVAGGEEGRWGARAAGGAAAAGACGRSGLVGRETNGCGGRYCRCRVPT